MQLHRMGMNYRHTGNFTMDRPQGSGDNLLIVFRSSAYVLAGGAEKVVQPGSCIVYRNGSPQYYRIREKAFVNDFVHFDCGDEDALAAAGLRFDEPFLLSNLPDVEDIFRLLSREQISDAPSSESNTDLLLRLLVSKVSESIPGGRLSPGNNRRHDELREIRSEIYSNAGKYTRLQELADRMNLSISHFQVLYKKEFGVSCYDDLLTAKITDAQYYLAYTDLSVKEITRLCGYDSDISFMRCFKNRTGMTPTDYRLTESIIE